MRHVLIANRGEIARRITRAGFARAKVHTGWVEQEMVH